VLRGPEAAKAKPVDLVSPAPVFALDPIGPWADELSEAYAGARKEGFTQGRVEGYDQAIRQGTVDAGRQARQLIEALEAMMAQLEVRMAQEAERVASEAANLALEIASAILAREVATADDPGGEAIARCLAVAPAEGDLVAHLHPEDARRLGEVGGLGDRGLTVKADERVERGDAVVRVDETLIDGRLARALEQVAEVLR
jgi:flagellar assembly protein FliH